MKDTLGVAHMIPLAVLSMQKMLRGKEQGLLVKVGVHFTSFGYKLPLCREGSFGLS